MKLFKAYFPLCILQNKLLAYKYGSLYFISLEDYSIKKIESIDNSFTERLLSRFRLFNRFFRLGIRASIPINENSVLIYFKNRVFEYSFDRKLSKGISIENGIRPLYFTNINNISGFEEMIVFGGYLSNPPKKSVSIYKRDNIDQWSPIFTFKEGEINHIHNIIPDKYNNCVWIFTGDFDSSAGIWKATDNFKKVEPFLLGEQKYRACVGFPTSKGLYYATDTPFEDNYIYLLEGKILKTIKHINGSCIYGTKIGNNLIFTTAVEGDGRDSSLLKLFFNIKIGEGIKDNYCHIYAGDLSNNFIDIYSEKKDFYPFIFQFGTFQFPSGENNTSKLIYFSTATKKDGYLIIRDLYKD